ncbi:MAG: hypothetical protein BJG00_012285 [Limnothrix sp. CACIAM 69d]|nr:MAG: hypothetical protein BJG00_012285 [Limnothrix sp. CACIAM 69d]
MGLIVGGLHAQPLRSRFQGWAGLWRSLGLGLGDPTPTAMEMTTGHQAPCSLRSSRWNQGFRQEDLGQFADKP